MRGAEGNGGPKERGPELVVVGHVGTSIVHAGAVSWTSAGGSGYAVAASAGTLIGDRAGLVAAVGTDFDLAPLRGRQVDLDGVTELPGPSAKLRIREFDDGTRSFSAELGVAAAVQTETFPARYLDADYIHLGTAPPDQQLAWLEYLHERGCRAHISADMFEHYVATYPTTSREVCDSVDLIFMNQAEYDGLYGDAQLPVPKAPLIVKRGPFGARLIVDGHPQEVEAARRTAGGPDGRRRGAGRRLPRAAGGRAAGAPSAAVRGPRRVQLRGGLRRHRLAPDRRARDHPQRDQGIPARLIALPLRRQSSPPLRGRAARRSPWLLTSVEHAAPEQ